MERPYRVAWSVSVASLVFGANVACGQTYPGKPVRLLTTGIGAGSDLAAHTVAQGLTDSVGWNVVVDNRGSTIVSAEVVSRAPNDGHTLSSTTVRARSAHPPISPPSFST